MNSFSKETDNRTQLNSWPGDKEIYLTLDLECDYGTAIKDNIFYSVNHTDILIDLLENNSTPLTCFVQTEVIDEVPSAMTSLKTSSIPTEFHAHSHSHPRRCEANVEFELETSISRIKDEFPKQPTGYRFPDGTANSRDYQVLSEHGVQFNASLFPSWRPGRFNNIRDHKYPYLDNSSGVIEIPFTVINWVRIPVSLSYMKLLGDLFEWLIKSNPPPVIVFDFHMHDLVVPPAFEQLPTVYKIIYSRRKHSGLDVLDNFISYFKKQGYSFNLISDLYYMIDSIINNNI